jgi:glucose-1-phosphate cytidylyltransferase
MVLIGGRPIIWHIMNHYASYGFTDFVVACGYKGHVLKDYFANYRTQESDLRVDLATGDVAVLSEHAADWTVTLVNTGESTMTAGRIKRLAPLLTETFMLTYGDGIADVPIDDLLDYHRAHGLTATVTAVNPIPRWGALSIADSKVVGFVEKPADGAAWINGGFFVMEPELLDLIEGDHSGLEQSPMEALVAMGQLGAFQHSGFWMAMDTARDRDELNDMWNAGNAPWARP